MVKTFEILDIFGVKNETVSFLAHLVLRHALESKYCQKMMLQNIMIKIKIRFFKEQETLCDSVVADQVFDFHAVND